MDTKKCKMCGTTEQLQRHHIYPVCHFGKKNNHDITILCDRCHKKVEHYILVVESFVGEVPMGRRHKLQYFHYKQIKEVLKL